MGTSNCVYAISSRATSNPSGVAIKTDTTSKTISCSGSACSGSGSSGSSGSSSSGSSGSGGSTGGGGSGSSSSPSSSSSPAPEEVPHFAPAYSINENTLDLGEYQTWVRDGKTTLANLQESQTISFTYVTKSLEEQDWVMIIEDIDAEKSKVTLFIKENGREASQVDISFGVPAQLDLDEDGIIDVTISLTAVEETGVTLSFEKAEAYIEQEQQLIAKKRKTGLIITLGILGGVLFLGVIYFLLRKRFQIPKKQESLTRRYSKK